MAEINIGIKGMHCKSCVQRIEEGLLKIDGIESVSVSLEKEKANIAFDEKKVSRKRIEEEIGKIGYAIVEAIGQKTLSKKNTLGQGLLYGLIPHVGCIGFIVASILGVTFATELFKPILLTPFFFQIMIAIPLFFATLSSVLYLKNNGLLSIDGIKRKKAYLALMYGSTIFISVILMFVIFPMTANFNNANLDNAITTETANVAALAENAKQQNETIRLKVEIPCSGHASLVSEELKKIAGIIAVKYSIPDFLDVTFDQTKTSKEEILSLEIFGQYPAKIIK